MGRQATLREVAARAGVSASTASMALAGLDVVRQATRARVEAAARELGYRRNVAAAVMAAGRRRARVMERPLSLGFVCSPEATARRPEAFRIRAQELGYGVEWVDMREFRSPAEALRILWHRNVAGLFLSSPGALPEEREWVEAVAWERFAVVKFTRARPELRFPLIRHSAFDYAERALREVFAAGYHRVAALLRPSASEMDDCARVGAIEGWRSLRLRRGQRIVWKMIHPQSTPGLDSRTTSWLRRQAPETVIGFPSVLYWDLQRAGFRIPEDVAFVAMVGEDTSGRIAACHANMDGIRARAAEILHQMIAAGQRGMSDSPWELVVEPIWIPGNSFPSPRVF